VLQILVAKFLSGVPKVLQEDVGGTVSENQCAFYKFR
jgi:hypothetical protein